MDLQQSAIVRSLFQVRALVLGSAPTGRPGPRGLLAQAQALGWEILADVPGREVVLGAVTRPWEADAIFRGMPADEFATFDEPGYVKIAWTLRADPVTAATSVVRTETRVIATDPVSRARFRRYWSVVSPGVVWIRRIILGLVKREAERRARGFGGQPETAAARR